MPDWKNSNIWSWLLCQSSHFHLVPHRVPTTARLPEVSNYYLLYCELLWRKYQKEAEHFRTLRKNLFGAQEKEKKKLKSLLWITTVLLPSPNSNHSLKIAYRRWVQKNKSCLIFHICQVKQCAVSSTPYVAVLSTNDYIKKLNEDLGFSHIQPLSWEQQTFSSVDLYRPWDGRCAIVYICWVLQVQTGTFS